MKTEFAQPVVKMPSACSGAEIVNFIALVLAGSEVIACGLENRVRAAERIVFLRRSEGLIGVAGLKRPSANHRKEVAASAGVPLPPNAFPFELGWVFIMPSARGNHLSLPLCRPLIEAAGDQGVFATSKTKNDGMHSTLGKLGFSSAGKAYPSRRGDYQLQVFLRHAGQPCTAAGRPKAAVY
jgi:hypothetical protein